RVLRWGDRYPNHRYALAFAREGVERSLDLLDHEWTRVMAEGVDEGDDHNLAVELRQRHAPTVLIGQREIGSSQPGRHRRAVEAARWRGRWSAPLVRPTAAG